MKPRPSWQSQRSQAFTLIEVLMAMTIFTLVIAAIYATWTIILKSSKIGLEAAAQVQRERIAVQTIEQALMSARSFQADIDRYAFEVENGNNGSLSFVAKLPESFPRSGVFWSDVRRVTFSIENGQNQGFSERQLVMRQNPILMDLSEDEELHPLVLARNIDEMLFEFWDGRKNEWSDSWAQSNTLPRLVRFTIAFTKPNQQHSGYQKEEITRIVGIPTTTVPPNWQGGQPGRPGQPGVPPGQTPPGQVPPGQVPPGGQPFRGNPNPSGMKLP